MLIGGGSHMFKSLAGYFSANGKNAEAAKEPAGGSETMGNMVRKKIVFFGRVQGVGFRYRAKYAAAGVGATGWVRNEYDGSVVMEIQGTEEQINAVILEIEQGRYIRIENMAVENLPPVDGERGFRTRW